MSNIFIKNNLKELLSDISSEQSITLPKYINFVDLKDDTKSLSNTFLPNKYDSFKNKYNSVTSSEFMSQINDKTFSTTSESVVKQSGGALSETSLNNTTSSFMPQQGGSVLSETSLNNTTSSFIPQQGGNFSATSNIVPQKGGSSGGAKNNDINHLISMITSESENNSTSTEVLENKLREMLSNDNKQKGGAKNNSEIQNAIKLLKSHGFNVTN